jgi:hypothetical protein
MPTIATHGTGTARLRDALLSAFDRDGVIDLVGSIGRDFRAMEVATSDFEANVRKLVEDATAEHWVLDLFAKAHELVPADPGLKRILDSLLPVEPPPGVDHFETCRLTGSFVMMDRTRLRQTLRNINEPGGNRILVVTGGVRTGKSHTARFIEYLAEVRRDFNFVLIDLDDVSRLLGPGRPVEPDEIATRLVKRLGYEQVIPDAPTDEQWSRWVFTFCENFEVAAREDAARRCWVVIDAFDSVAATQATLDLVKELAIRISNTLNHFRLVLLGYETTLPPRVGGHLAEESIGQIDAAELILFFRAAFKQLGLPDDDDTVLPCAARSLQGLDPGSEDYLMLLSPRVSKELADAEAKARAAPGPPGGGP